MLESLRVIVTILSFACILGFANAVVHARDNTDRVYLLGTATILSGGGVGSLAHRHDPVPPPVLVAICLTILGQAFLLVGAAMSRRRRLRNSNGGRDG